MNCSVCGADNREGARFCRSCGHELLESQALASDEAEELEEVAEEEGAVEPMPEEGSREEMPSRELSQEEVSPSSMASSPREALEDQLDKKMDVESPVGEDAVKGQIEPAFSEDTENKKGDKETVPEGVDSDVVPEQPIPEAGGASPTIATETEKGEDLPSLMAQAELLGQEETVAEGDEALDSGDEILAFWREEAQQMIPVELGTVIEDRYAVVETLDVQENEILYRALDLRRCWQCGHAENDPEGAFCARCGVLMDRRPDVQLVEVREAGMEPATGKLVMAHLQHETRHFLLLAEREPEPEHRPEPPWAPVAFRLLVGQRSEPGLVRELDEDSLFALTLSPTYESRTGPVLGLFAVADGMGGHASGEVASRMALQVLVERVLQTVILSELSGELVLEEDILALLRQAMIAANDDVYLARKKRDNDMGTTLSTVFIRDNRLFLAHVGDGRVYRFSAEGLEQLTTDHSVVASMIADGQARPEDLYTHPHRSIVYRCIGDKPVVEVDTDILPLAPSDRIIICCDGVWEMLRDEGIEDVMMQEADPQAACDVMVRRANAAGGEDNISVIVVQAEALAALED